MRAAAGSPRRPYISTVTPTPHGRRIRASACRSTSMEAGIAIPSGTPVRGRGVAKSTVEEPTQSEETYECVNELSYCGTCSSPDTVRLTFGIAMAPTAIPHPPIGSPIRWRPVHIAVCVRVAVAVAHGCAGVELLRMISDKGKTGSSGIKPVVGC